MYLQIHGPVAVIIVALHLKGWKNSTIHVYKRNHEYLLHLVLKIYDLILVEENAFNLWSCLPNGLLSLDGRASLNLKVTGSSPTEVHFSSFPCFSQTNYIG